MSEYIYIYIVTDPYTDETYYDRETHLYRNRKTIVSVHKSVSLVLYWFCEECENVLAFVAIILLYTDIFHRYMTVIRFALSLSQLIDLGKIYKSYLCWSYKHSLRYNRPSRWCLYSSDHSTELRKKYRHISIWDSTTKLSVRLISSWDNVWIRLIVRVCVYI